MIFRGFEELLPLRGRWLRYFLLAVVLALPVSAALTTPILLRREARCGMGVQVSLWDVLQGK